MSGTGPAYAYDSQVPMALQEVFIPDQLIAGSFPTVTGQQVYVTGAGPLKRGTVLGEGALPAVTVTPTPGNVGNGVVSNVSLAEFAPVGTYLLTEATPETFNVSAPNGDNLGIATVGVQFTNQISFLITDGATHYAAGDSISLVTVAGSGEWKISVATANDGSQVPAAILADGCDPTLGPVNAAVYLTGEFNINALIYDPSWGQAALVKALRGSNIWVKNSVSAAPPVTTIPVG